MGCWLWQLCLTQLKTRASALETNGLVGFALTAIRIPYYYRPQRYNIYPLILSISLSGGK